jgi:hypothetical protein
VEDNDLTWDGHQDLTSRRTYSYLDGGSRLESYQYEVDAQGNWTRRSGNLPAVVSGAQGTLAQPMPKAVTLTRSFEYYPSSDQGCPQGLNDRLEFVPAGLR